MADNRRPIVGMVYRANKGANRRLVTGLGPAEGPPSTREPGAGLNGGYNVHYKGSTLTGWGKERSCYVSTWDAWASSQEPDPVEGEGGSRA